MGKSKTGSGKGSRKQGVNNGFDYIIVGAGGAGLSLLMRMLDHPALANKTILLADRAPKTANDRTWCFWEKGQGYFEDIVHHRWKELWFRHPEEDIRLSLGGYAYKMIRAADFYRYCFARIRNAGPRVRLLYGEVSAIDAENGSVTVDGTTYSASLIFSSALLQPPRLLEGQYYLLQHFRGWVIETAEDVFNPDSADLMNFRVSQQHGTTFVYVLPLGPRRALVEYTLFSHHELALQEYEEGLRHFMENHLGITRYRIAETEQGVIPMTNLSFPVREGKVVFLGTAGGQTKASTGYTFQNMQKHAAFLVQQLAAGLHHNLSYRVPPRFSLYDSVLLGVLHHGEASGSDIFLRMFRTNPAPRVFRFLDNETRFDEELGIMRSAPTLVFIRAAIRELRRNF